MTNKIITNTPALRFQSVLVSTLIAFLFLLPDGLFSQESSNNEKDLSSVFEIGTVHSLMVQQGDSLLYEEFRGRMSRDRPTNIKSASKSILSLLIGIAIEEGYIESVDQPIGQFFPDYFEANPDPAKESITIKDLLTMRSGLETTSFHNYGRWVLNRNWVRFTLSRPMEDEPGGRMIYSTGSSHLLSVILTRASGMNTRAFANQYLFRPMNIRVGGWDRDPQGYFFGGNNMALSPEALLKTGRLMLDLGEYNGKQLVPKEWILDSVKIYTRSNFNNYNYGYMWWRKEVGGHEVVFAWGNGGQYILMLPELDAVVSITSDVEQGETSRRYQRMIFNYVEEVVIPVLVSLQ